MRVWCTVALVVLASCGGGDHAVVLHAPFIQNLVIRALTPLVEGQRGVYEFRADFADPDGDLDGGPHGDLVRVAVIVVTAFGVITVAADALHRLTPDFDSSRNLYLASDTYRETLTFHVRLQTARFFILATSIALIAVTVLYAVHIVERIFARSD